MESGRSLLFVRPTEVSTDRSGGSQHTIAPPIYAEVPSFGFPQTLRRVVIPRHLELWAGGLASSSQELEWRKCLANVSILYVLRYFAIWSPEGFFGSKTIMWGHPRRSERQSISGSVAVALGR